MGAVVNAVFSAVEDVVEVVGDAVETVSDVVETVVDTVGTAVEGVLENPLPVILQIAGSMVGIPPYITSGVISAAQGGDLEDIALSMGTSYMAPQVGGAISATVSEAFIDAGMNEAFAEVASNAISKGLVNGTIAEVKGGSFEDGFAGGFTGGMVAGGVSEVASYVKPEIIQLAQDSGLDLSDANAVYNAGAKALAAGITSEVTGKGDFGTSFTNSAVSSGVAYGTSAVNNTIDDQFKTAATDWNEKDKEGTQVDVSTTGAGVPNDVVAQVAVSNIGVDNKSDTVDAASVSPDGLVTEKTTVADTVTPVLPEKILSEAPQAETANDFSSLIEAEKQTPVEDVQPEQEVLPPTEAKSALQIMSEMAAPTIDSDNAAAPDVVSEAAVPDNLLATEPTVGGLNSVAQPAQATPEAKASSSMGFKPTDITKPIVAIAGNLIKQKLTQPTRQAPRAPTGGLRAATQAAPAPRVDVSKLIPIERANPVAPPKTLPSTAKLSPVANIAGLTSLLQKTG